VLDERKNRKRFSREIDFSILLSIEVSKASANPKSAALVERQLLNVLKEILN
jgi:hypothetical protein